VIRKWRNVPAFDEFEHYKAQDKSHDRNMTTKYDAFRHITAEQILTFETDLTFV